jgi:MurNAc alpha-1-phosphate uridylyltransferase
MPHENIPVMIFGAGFGTRMRELTADKPKPLINVAGRALIDYALDIAGGRQVVVNTHYHANQMQSHLAHHTNVEISHEHPDILETGGGLRLAMPLLKTNPVITLNSDAVWSGTNPLDLLEAAWEPKKMDALLLLIPLERTVGFTRGGDFAVTASGRLSRDKAGMIYTGAQIVKTDQLTSIPEASFSLNKLWDQMHIDDRLFGLEYPGHWADVGSPEGIPLAEKLLAGSYV